MSKEKKNTQNEKRKLSRQERKQIDTLIDRILIHELDRETNTRKIEIHYSFVGQVDTEQEPTQVVNHDRRNMVDVKSIAI